MKKNYPSLFFYFLFFGLIINLSNAQQSYTFTSCGATASLGPTQLQVNNAYLSTNLSGQVISNNGIQSWTVPTSGLYRIAAHGAQGGGADGGKGAIIAGDFNLTAGDVLRIVVGQQGITLPTEPNSCGGGGGSYVMKGPTNTVPDIAVIAGGGGGSPASYTISRHASIGPNGNYGAGASNTDGAGGTNGNGGNKGIAANNQDRAAGGGGFFTDGQSTAQPSFIGAANGGSAFVNGSIGGTHNTTGVPGGFGGGGAVWTTGHKGGGGGGGYSGGGGGQTNGSNANTHSGGGGGSFNNGTNQLNVISTFTGDGKVIITELCNISLTASTTNSLNPSICSGQSLTLTTNAVSNYSWSTGASTQSIVVSPTSTTVYSLSATSISACTAYANMTVIVSGGQPTLSVVSSTNQTCLGKTATLTASGALTYTWTNGVTNGVSFFPQSTNTYTVTGENGCGTVTAVSTITVSPLALSVVSSNSVVCTNKTATLAATAAATSYTWQPGNIIGASPNLIINPQANTNYTITATDGTCVGVANVSVNADPVPTIQIASSATTACPGDVVTFTASGGSNYTWTANNQTGTTLSTSLSTTTLITVQGDNQFGCISNTSQVVSVQTAPTINVATASPSICSGSSSTLNVTGANSYTWTGGSNGNSFVVNPSQTTVYSVDGSNTGNPCIATKTLEVTVFTPVLTITGNTVICNGVQTNLTAGSASTYSWTHDAPFYNANTSVSPNTNTTYTVNATHEFNGGQVKCPISGTIEVIVNPTPTISAIATRTSMCAKETNTLNANGASTYTWVTTNTTIAANSLTINPTTASILTYTLNGTSAQGCEANTVFLFNVSSCTGIEESKTNNVFVNIYPNPSQGNFTIETGKEMQLKLINQLGQVIEVIQLNEKNNYKTSLSNLSNGVYFISGNDLNKKVIVNK